MIPLGQYPAAGHVIAHISDTHLLGGDKLLYGHVPSDLHIEKAMAQLEKTGIKFEALVFTGDLADLGERDAYERLKAIVEPAAARIGAQVIWVMGNHDERPEYASVLFGVEETTATQDRVYDINGLRIISLDTTVPGYHHGELTDDQLAWLADVLATPAAHGTIIAVHHPPVPTPMLWAMEMLELHDQQRFADVVRGTDVRAILGGHLHYSTHSTFAGIPVSVASATCYTLTIGAEGRLFSGVDAGQAFNAVHVYKDQIVHSIVPIGENTEITGFSSDNIDLIASLSFDERLDLFSRKNSRFNEPGAPTSDF